MNYFPFHIGDYAAATSHLSWDEDMAYTRLLRAYYRTEKPIPHDKAYRLASATTPAQRKAVDTVLAEFFDKAGDVYMQARCEVEILAYQEGDADREQKVAHEKERMRRHRERRAELFAALREVGIVPAWDAPLRELQRLADTNCNAPATRTGAFLNEPATHLQREQNAPATATHTHTHTQEPRTKNQEPKNSVGSAKRRTQIPADFEPNETGIKTAVTKGVQVATELVKFKDFHSAKGSVMLDWQAAWRTWVGNARPQPPIGTSEPAWRTEQRKRTIQAVPSIAENHSPASEFFEIEAKNVTSIAVG